MQLATTQVRIAAGVLLTGAGVIAGVPAPVARPGVQVADVRLASDEIEMVLDLVRHGESTDNVAGIIGTTPPGAGLTANGETEAAFLASPDNPQALAAPDSYDGIYASDFLRTNETAEAWLSAAGSNLHVTDLAGLNEVNAGFLDGSQETEINGLLYLVGPLSWIFGNDLAPELGSASNPNGVAFDENFSSAVQTIYDAGGATTDGHYTDVAFSHALAMATWVMMNVKNPDFGLFFKDLEGGVLPNTAQVIVEGDPTDGWTLVSYDGVDIPQDPGLLTELFVDYRDLITAPQIAGYNIYEAILGGDPTTITSALQTGFDQVVTALEQFPVAVYDSIADTTQTLTADLAGASAGDLGTLIEEAVIGTL